MVYLNIKSLIVGRLKGSVLLSFVADTYRYTYFITRLTILPDFVTMRVNRFLYFYYGKDFSSRSDLKRYNKYYISIKNHLFTKYSSNLYKRATIFLLD